MKASDVISEGRGGYIAYVLTDASRAKLLAAVPAVYPEVIAHHITYKFGVSDAEPLPDQPTSIRAVKAYDAGDGVQAVEVEVDGSSARPDGGVFHVTISIDRAAGRTPVHSKKLIASTQGEPIDVEINATPEFIAT